MSPEANLRKTCWPVRIVKIAVHAGLAVFLLALLAKFWIAPAVIRHQVSSALGQRWRGEVSLEAVEFNYFGPIRLRGLRLAGPARREWAWVGQAALYLRGWPGPHPYLTAVHVQQVRLAAYFAAGRCELPLLAPAEPKGEGLAKAGEYLDVRSVRVDDLRVALVDREGVGACAWRFRFSADRGEDGRYGVRLLQESPTASVVPALSGSVDAKTLASRLRVKLNHGIRKEDVGLLLSTIGGARIRRADGFVDVDVSLEGPLDRPGELKTAGTIELTDVRAETDDGQVLDELDLQVRMDTGKAVLTGATMRCPAGSVRVGASPIQYDLARGTVSAEVRGLIAESDAGDYGGFWRGVLGETTVRGKVLATGQIGFDPHRPQPLRFDVDVKPDLAEVRFAKSPEHNLKNVTARRLRLRTTEIDAHELEATFAKGRAKLSAAVRLDAGARPPTVADWARAECLSGNGVLFMDDVDLVGVPVLPGLLQTMNVLPKGQKGLSDLHLLFALDRGTVTVQEGKLANPLSALDVEKGGKIDLGKKHLDLHVVVVGIKQLHTVLKRIPLLNLAVGFKDKLTRFHVVGPWDDPPASLIRKEPLKDLSKGTQDFFKGVVGTGGQIGPGILKGLKGIGELFKKLDEALKKEPAKPPAR